MFEARLVEVNNFKKVLDALSCVIDEGSFECSGRGISLQAMDSSHISLVSMILRNDCFETFRCDRKLAMGINLKNLGKIMKCAGSKDTMTLKAEDEGDTLTIMFESPNGEKVSDFAMKLMDIDQEHVGIPETEYSAIIKMPSNEYSRIVRDMANFGDSTVICCTKEGVQFSSSGEIGSASIKLAQTANADDGANVSIEMKEACTLTFGILYLNHFAKAAPLAEQVSVILNVQNPLVVEFKIPDMGHIRYYLAPKMDDMDDKEDDD